MGDWLKNLSEIERLFVAAIVCGVLLFLLRVVLGIFAGEDSLGDGDDGRAGGDGALKSFRILSLQGFSAFALMFGLVGMALVRQEATSNAVAVLGGVAAGGVTVWILGRILLGLGRLEADGTIRLSRAVGVTGTVDLTIPPGGTGKVRIIVQERLRVYDAVSQVDVPLYTGDRIRVVGVLEGNVLLVEPNPLKESEAI